jgi:predicted NBD/HSP70 family sugar kinase
MSYILLDIGDTKTRVAITQDLKTIDTSIRFDTPANYTDAISKIASEAKKLTGKTPIRGVGCGMRGVLDEEKSGIVRDPGGALSSWEDESITGDLKKELGSEVYLENDAAIAGMGEALYGAGQGHDIMVYLAVGTGVGGAKIEEGMVDDYAHGFEPGHQILDIDHTILGEDVEPTLENLVSGTAVEKRMGMKPYDIPQDDAIWDQLAVYLAHGLRNSILYWSPDAIVLGGSMIVGNPRILLNDIIMHTNTVMGDIVDVPIILDATLGDEGGLYGAMALLSQKV